jgi:hypothetical protein
MMSKSRRGLAKEEVYHTGDEVEQSRAAIEWCHVAEGGTS